MILITLFFGTAIALKSDDEPNGYMGAMYFPPARPIYERPTRTLGDWSLDEKKYFDENKYFDEDKYIGETIYKDDKKHVYPIDLYEQPNGYLDAMYFPPSRPIYERPTRTLADWSLDEKKYFDETKYIGETKYNDDKKHVYPFDLYQQSKGFPSSNYFLPTRPLVGNPAKTLGEWYPYKDDTKAYFYPNDLFEQMLASNRLKRDAAGALRIQTNHALPIHADVKPVGSRDPAETAVTVTEKPCPPSKYKPSHIENGVVFQVTAPEDTIYEVKSLRKSLLPLPSKLDIARSINRIITIVALLACAVVEFYPLLDTLFNVVYSFVYL